MVHVDHDALRAGFGQARDGKLEQRASAHLDQGFGAAVGQGTQAGAQSGGKYESFHANTTRFAVNYCLARHPPSLFFRPVH